MTSIALAVELQELSHSLDADDAQCHSATVMSHHSDYRIHKTFIVKQNMMPSDSLALPLAALDSLNVTTWFVPHFTAHLDTKPVSRLVVYPSSRAAVREDIDNPSKCTANSTRESFYRHGKLEIAYPAEKHESKTFTGCVTTRGKLTPQQEAALRQGKWKAFVSGETLPRVPKRALTETVHTLPYHVDLPAFPECKDPDCVNPEHTQVWIGEIDRERMTAMYDGGVFHSDAPKNVKEEHICRKSVKIWWDQGLEDHGLMSSSICVRLGITERERVIAVLGTHKRLLKSMELTGHSLGITEGVTLWPKWKDSVLGKRWIQFRKDNPAPTVVGHTAYGKYIAEHEYVPATESIVPFFVERGANVPLLNVRYNIPQRFDEWTASSMKQNRIGRRDPMWFSRWLCKWHYDDKKKKWKETDGQWVQPLSTGVRFSDAVSHQVKDGGDRYDITFPEHRGIAPPLQGFRGNTKHLPLSEVDDYIATLVDTTVNARTEFKVVGSKLALNSGKGGLKETYSDVEWVQGTKTFGKHGAQAAQRGKLVFELKPKVKLSTTSFYLEPEDEDFVPKPVMRPASKVWKDDGVFVPELPTWLVLNPLHVAEHEETEPYAMQTVKQYYCADTRTHRVRHSGHAHDEFCIKQTLRKDSKSNDRGAIRWEENSDVAEAGCGTIHATQLGNVVGYYWKDPSNKSCAPSVLFLGLDKIGNHLVPAEVDRRLYAVPSSDSFEPYKPTYTVAKTREAVRFTMEDGKVAIFSIADTEEKSDKAVGGFNEQLRAFIEVIQFNEYGNKAVNMQPPRFITEKNAWVAKLKKGGPTITLSEIHGLIRDSKHTLVGIEREELDWTQARTHCHLVIRELWDAMADADSEGREQEFQKLTKKVDKWLGMAELCRLAGGTVAQNFELETLRGDCMNSIVWYRSSDDPTVYSLGEDGEVVEPKNDLVEPDTAPKMPSLGEEVEEDVDDEVVEDVEDEEESEVDEDVS